MNTFAHLVNLAMTFTIFCGVVSRLIGVPRPTLSFAAIAEWLLLGVSYICIAIGTLGLFFHGVGMPGHVSHWCVLTLHSGLASYFLTQRRIPAWSGEIDLSAANLHPGAAP